MKKIEASRLSGSIGFQSNLNLIDIGRIVSQDLLGGATLGGLEKQIYDEVPAIFSEFLGMRVILSGESKSTGGVYTLSFLSNFKIKEESPQVVRFDNYLKGLCESKENLMRYIEWIDS